MAVLELNADLVRALDDVLGRKPTTPEPVVVLSAYIYSLALGYGLSDSQHLSESQLGPPTRRRKRCR
jgi:hypothetical protein